MAVTFCTWVLPAIYKNIFLLIFLLMVKETKCWWGAEQIISILQFCFRKWVESTGYFVHLSIKHLLSHYGSQRIVQRSMLKPWILDNIQNILLYQEKNMAKKICWSQTKREKAQGIHRAEPSSVSLSCRQDVLCFKVVWPWGCNKSATDIPKCQDLLFQRNRKQNLKVSVRNQY